MAHFAELDDTNTVVRVVVVHNDVTTIDGVEDEQRGIDFLADLHPDSGRWVQTSFNHNTRTRYAGVGSTYDEASDAFITPQPHPSWTLDDEFVWLPPVPYPVTDPTVDDPVYEWDEASTSWVPA